MDNRSSSEAKDKFIENLNYRFYNTLNYLTLFVYVFIVSAAALVTDYILVLLLEFLFLEDISKSSFVAQAFYWYKTGSAFLVLAVFMIHAIMSSYSQLRFEFETAKNG